MIFFLSRKQQQFAKSAEVNLIDHAKKYTINNKISVYFKHLYLISP